MLKIVAFTRDALAKGSFDGGKIREVKPLGFAGEPAPLERVGPLFYWAWATASEPAFIEEHPHRTFEILTYVLEGRVEHRDSLGNVSVVGPGGAQLMRTNSGLWHSERILEGPASLMQIWFEPERRLAHAREPSYEAAQAPAEVRGPHGARVTPLVGPGSTLAVEAPVAAASIRLEPTTLHDVELADGGAVLAALVVDGSVTLDGRSYPSGTFLTAEAVGSRECLSLSSDVGARVVTVATLVRPGYPLYHKARPKLGFP